MKAFFPFSMRMKQTNICISQIVLYVNQVCMWLTVECVRVGRERERERYFKEAEDFYSVLSDFYTQKTTQTQIITYPRNSNFSTQIGKLRRFMFLLMGLGFVCEILPLKFIVFIKDTSTVCPNKEMEP